jgi:hypothetical protein
VFDELEIKGKSLYFAILQRVRLATSCRLAAGNRTARLLRVITVQNHGARFGDVMSTATVRLEKRGEARTRDFEQFACRRLGRVEFRFLRCAD